MKYVKIALVLTAAVICAIAFSQPARADVSFDMAYSNLSDHGSWLVSAQYGHVWQPREYNRGWSPYHDGHWVYTDMGWAWVSDYAWGAIPYHYGTWVMDSHDGWVWIPGSVWAPAWVVFRTTPEYVGWAPVPPGFSVGMSIDTGGLSSFVFVSSRDFMQPRLSGSFIPQERTNVFIGSTTVVNNIVIQNNVVINRGPDYRTIEHATGRTIREERIESVARVAPYSNVTRAQLAVAPERVKQGVRVAEPVPASQPLPVAGQHGQPNNQGHAQAPVPVAAPAHGNAQQNAAAPQQHAKAQSDAQAQQQHAQAQQQNAQAQQQNAQAQQQNAAAQQQHAKAQSDAKAQQQHTQAQQQNAAAQQQHAKAQSDAQAQQQHAKAQSDAQAQQQHAKAQSDAQAQQQHAKAQSDAQAQQQHAKAQSDAQAQQQHAKAQSDAKPPADAKAKKDQPPPKKDQGGDKGGSEEPKKDSGK